MLRYLLVLFLDLVVSVVEFVATTHARLRGTPVNSLSNYCVATHSFIREDTGTGSVQTDSVLRPTGALVQLKRCS